MKHKFEKLIFVLICASTLAWPQLGLTGTSELDWEQIADDADDGVTALDLDSDGSTFDLHWGLVNEEGVFSLRTHSINLLDDVGVERMTLLRNGNVGIGTTAPAQRLHSAGTNHPLLLEDNSANRFDFNVGGTGLWLLDDDSQAVLKLNHSATTNALVVDGAGVGIGTSSPDASLNVEAGSTAQIRVDNTTVSPAAGDQAMFRLQSAAPNKVRFLIGNAGGLWTFDNAGGSFQINKAGTGSNEFRVENDGDIVALGNSYAVNHVNTSSRDSKTDFAPIDEIAVLEKLSALPMSTWRYKVETEDKRHLGPVAEDFKLAFGLSDGKHISTVDASGVALTAIKGLNRVLQERTAEIAELTEANSELQKANSDLISANQALDDRLTRLENVLLRQNEVAVR